MSAGHRAGPAARVRCAIYTRKSSDEGLEQSFNSLDAQREACAAYILSQASEGWCEVKEHYDDGGISGGTLERPALQRLLADVAAGRVDIIVVYKVDRLTRSLLDFAKLVEAFDKAGTSFVSITQSFNTTTSMGRLTLNMLLSFAQFEREVTAERIRDKIAASKAKGMWMGGIPPLGYQPNGRSLAIVDEHAAVVRTIYQRYLTPGMNVRLLAEQLRKDGVLSPQRSTATGKPIGGGAFSRGQLYLMLKCRTYLGEVSHKDQVYPGLHPAIIDRDMWDAVQAKLVEHTQGTRSRTRAAQPSLLAGKVTDEAGEPLIATHATKPVPSGVGGGRARYRYYVSQALHHKTGQGMRIPARELEVAVTERLAQMLDDPLELAETAQLRVGAGQIANVATSAALLAARVRRREHELTRMLIDKVVVERQRITIACSVGYLTAALQVEVEAEAPATIALEVTARLTRSGRVMRLVQADGAALTSVADGSPVRLIAKAHRWWGELRKGEQDITTYAAAEGVMPSYMTRVLRLAFLAPDMTAAVVGGRWAGQSVTALMLTGVPAGWAKQQRALMCVGE